MIFERESCTAVQMGIAGICAELRQVKPLFCIEQTFRQADTPSKNHLGDFLTRGNGPEQQALLRMIAALVEIPFG
jgi:hypothetical protein